MFDHSDITPKAYFDKMLGDAYNITCSAIETTEAQELPHLNVFGEKLYLVKATGLPDTHEERHADVNETQPYFVAEGEPQPDEIHPLPVNDDLEYCQLFFKIPLTEEQIEAKIEERKSWGTNTNINSDEPPTADIAIEFTQEGIHISGWNGLLEQPYRQTEEGAEPGELEFDEASKCFAPAEHGEYWQGEVIGGNGKEQDILGQISDALEQDAQFRQAFEALITQDQQVSNTVDNPQSTGRIENNMGQTPDSLS